MKKQRRFLCMLLALCMAAAVLPVTALAADTVAEGTCGSSVTWSLDDEGTLTISGTGAMADYDLSTLVPWYSVRKSILAVVIEPGVTTVGDRAFYGCVNLASVSIPDSVTNIERAAFYNCSSLTSVTIPDGVTNIGVYAFYNCTSLTTVTIPGKLTSIGDNAFDSCSGLTSVFIPDSITSIGSGTFSSCSSLTDIYYAGSEEAWAAVTIGSNNTALTEAAIHYNSELPHDFVDVLSDAFYAEAVDWAFNNGIALGTSENTFSPEKNCTRAEIVTFLYRAADQPAADVSSALQFSDVAADSWYVNAVA